MNISRFQIQVATGRFTLPVVILICLLIWSCTIQSWSDLASLGITIIIGYLMIEANTAFTLIRTRSTLPVCIYWLVATSLFFLHPFEWTHFVPLIFILALCQLFNSYESTSPAIPIYHVFFFISLGSMIFPPMLYFTPLIWGSMHAFRSISGKSFLSSLLGIMTPYWFLFGYAFYYNKLPLFWSTLQEIFYFDAIDYSQLTKAELFAWAFITFLLLISGFHYWQIAYMDKTRTRIYHSFMVIAGIWTTLGSILQPTHIHEWMQIQLICASFLSGHLFTLTRNRFSAIYFIVTIILFILLILFNLWMQ
ncbi:MAG: hypothetical protein IKU64_05475 [Bacteroides sp.]|nr:hypothetical protein [Bacteroides sp.]